jgi:hypothetical protein
MTAIRVVTDHQELENSGAVTHADLDTYVNTTPFLVVSGAAGAVPPGARRLVAGPGISIVDGGPGGDLTISATGTATAPIQWNEVPSGSNDGSNTAFTLAFTPSPPMALMLFINGVKQRQGADSDYTLTGSLINLITGYRSGSNIDATYPY